jgi:hypothetical protein
MVLNAPDGTVITRQPLAIPPLSMRLPLAAESDSDINDGDDGDGGDGNR